MTIKSRLILSFMAMIVITLMLGGGLSYQLYHLGNETNSNFDKVLSSVDTARRAWEHFRDAKDFANSVQLMIEPHDDADVANTFLGHYDMLAMELDMMEKNHLTPSITSLVKESKDLADSWRALQLRIMTGKDLETVPSSAFLVKLESSLENTIDEVVSLTIDHAHVQQGDAKAMVENVIRTALAILIGVGVLVCVLAILLSNSLTRPIQQLHLFMTDLASGRGDLTKRMTVNRRDEIGLVAEQFNRFLDTLRSMVTSVSESATGLQHATEHLQQKTAEVGFNIEQQKSIVESTTESTVQLRDSTGSIVQEAQAASDVAQTVFEQAQSSRRIVLESMEGIESLTSSIELTSGYINQLAEHGSRISRVVSVIQEISEQTNLLALNAAIEAARAGSYGRGFAVVADEVRNLAVKTQDSTNDIQSILESIQTGVSAAEKNMSVNSSQARNCVEQSVAIRDALALMSRSVAEINDMNSRILQATERQQRSTNDVGNDMQNVRGIAERSDGDMVGMRRQSMELQKTASALTEVVRGFTV